MNTLNPIAKHLSLRAPPACPAEPTWANLSRYDKTSKATIVVELQQPLIDLVGTCPREGTVDWSYKGERLSDNRDHRCWLSFEAKESCEESTTWKCFQDAIKRDSMTGKAYCKNDGEDSKPVQGDAFVLSVKKWAVIGLIIGMAVINGGTF